MRILHCLYPAPNVQLFWKYLHIYSCIVVLYPCTALMAQEGKVIEIVEAQSINFSEENETELFTLQGNVSLLHDSLHMLCDSALFYPKEERFLAIGEVYVFKGDQLKMWSDSLYYSGNTSIGIAKGNVHLSNDSIHLYSNEVTFDREKQRASFSSSGKLLHSTDTLYSKTGVYFLEEEKVEFEDSVRAYALEYTGRSHLLSYDLQQQEVSFRREAVIFTNEAILATEKGIFYREQKEMRCSGKVNAWNPPYYIEADSMFLEMSDSLIFSWGNVSLLEDSNGYLLQGDSAKAYARDSLAIVMGDCYGRASADSTWFVGKNLQVDKTQNTIYASQDVHVLQGEMEIVAEEIFSNRDSATIVATGKPVLFLDQTQILGDSVVVFYSEEELDSIFWFENVFYFDVCKEDSNLYNQSSSREMIIYADSNEISEIKHLGNVQVNFWVFENAILSGLNTMKGGEMQLEMQKGDLARMKYNRGVEAKFIPSQKITKNNLYLDQFLDRRQEKIQNSDIQAYKMNYPQVFPSPSPVRREKDERN